MLETRKEIRKNFLYCKTALRRILIHKRYERQKINKFGFLLFEQDSVEDNREKLKITYEINLSIIIIYTSCQKLNFLCEINSSKTVT